MHGAEFWKKVAKKEAICFLDVPSHPQLDEASCGQACLRMVYDFYRVRSRKFPQSTHEGTPGRLVVECLKQSALSPETPPHRISDRDLRRVLRLVDEGKPVIMAFGDKSTETCSHYAVLVGYSFKQLFLHDPFLRPYFPRSRRPFLGRWMRESKWYTGVGAPGTSMTV
jgi:hypothetical protein